MPHEIFNECPQAPFCWNALNSQGHIQQLHDVAHSIEDRVASQPFSGHQHLLMGDLDFTNMAIDNNIDHL